MNDSSNLFANVFGVAGEKDVLNQLVRASGFSSTMNGSTPQPVLKVPLQMGCFPGQRYFLENVKSALAEGEFYVDHEAGHLFVWPKPEWVSGGSKLEAVAPTGVSVMELHGTEFVTISNLTVRDSSYVSEGCWCGVAGEPNDAALVVNASHHVSIEACSFSAGIGGYAVGGTASNGLRVVGNHVEHVGQGGVMLWGNLLAKTQPEHATVS